MTLSRRRFLFGFFQSWHGPPSLTFFISLFYLFILNFKFGAPPKNEWTIFDEFSVFDTGYLGPPESSDPSVRKSWIRHYPVSI